MRALVPACAALAAAAVSAVSAPARARTILFDESHGQVLPMYSHDSFAEARDELRKAGHALVALKGSSAISSAVLSRVQVFYTGTLEAPLGPGEIAALHDWVLQGGGVIVGHDGGYSSDVAVASINAFLEPYGMAMAASSEYAEGVVVTGLAKHCLTEGIHSLGLDYVRPLARIAKPAVDLTTAGPEALGVYDGPAGWVIVLGDDTLWTNDKEGSDHWLHDLDNRAMLRNVFGYGGCRGSAPAAPPPPGKSGALEGGARAHGGSQVCLPRTPARPEAQSFRDGTVPAPGARMRRRRAAKTGGRKRRGLFVRLGKMLGGIPYVMPERLQAFMPATPLGHLFDGRFEPARLAVMLVAMAIGLAVQFGGVGSIRRGRPGAPSVDLA